MTMTLSSSQNNVCLSSNEHGNQENNNASSVSANSKDCEQKNTSAEMKASLTLAGSGITFYSQLTHECEAYIRQADIVLYLLNDPMMKAWINQHAKRAESLDSLYVKFEKRLDCYHAITKYILDCVRQQQHVCTVLYGHPCVFSKPGLDAVIQAEKEGFATRILPGISAEDCLFADLKIDPSTSGCLSFEASDFLIFQRPVDPACHLILWQIDAIGTLNNDNNANRHGLKLLVKKLSHYYAAEHTVILYEAAQHPGFRPRIDRIRLDDLQNTALKKISTLYIPPAKQTQPDHEIIKLLKLG